MSPVDSEFFQKRRNTFKSRADTLDRRSTVLSMIRILVFVGFFITVVLAANNSDLTFLVISFIVFGILFPVLVRIHNGLKFRQDHFNYLSRINQEEISRIEGKLDQFDEGREYIEDHHPYHIDLDIFGRNSLFQLLNHTTTYPGRQRLATWLSGRATLKDIDSRQKSVRELSRNIDWLQEFQATGMHTQTKTDTEVFFQWLNEKNRLYPKFLPAILRFAGPAIFLVLLGGAVFYSWSWNLVLLGFVLNGFILISYLRDINHVHQRTSGAIRSLESFEALISLIEKSEFKAEKLSTIRKVFLSGGGKASRIIGKLKRILQYLDNRGNMMYQGLNIIFLLDFYWVIAAEKWKARQPEHIRSWFHAVGDMEALNSLAAFSFLNPDYAFPDITPEPYHVSLSSAGHPLIPYSKRVNNDFSLKGRGKVALITGSNMAGKSTFLRTVGINAVLAMAGAPVCAEKMKLSLSQVFTAMRSQDNLEENISSFYAELDRIRHLLDLLEADEPVLYFLDELLKGTNSHDRHLGAVSLVHQLSGTNAMGLISTHDLALARETGKAAWVKNYSFESTIEDDEIFFDYTLHEGISKTLNASKLMEKMGIKLIKN